MVNRDRGDYPVAAGSLVWRLTVAACLALETEMRQGLDAIIAQANGGHLAAVRALVWASLQAYHGDRFPTVADVGPWMDGWSSPTSLRDELAAFLRANGPEERPQTEADEAATPKGLVWRECYELLRLAGLSAETYYALSLKELWRELRVADQRARRAQADLIRSAWWTVSLDRQKRLPKLQTLVGDLETRPTPKRAQSWQEMKAIMQGFKSTEQQGGTRGRVRRRVHR